jgi:hypothetical protein
MPWRDQHKGRSRGVRIHAVEGLGYMPERGQDKVNSGGIRTGYRAAEGSGYRLKRGQDAEGRSGQRLK